MLRKATLSPWLMLWVFCAAPVAGNELPLGAEFIGDPGAIGVYDSYGGDHYHAVHADLPTVKFTFDGFWFFRSGGDEDQPLILQDEFPAPASLTSGDLNFESKLGGRGELVFFATPGRFAPRASVLWTGTEGSRARRTGDPADILFFNAVDADPAPGYTARHQSRFTLADIGVRRTVSPAYGWSAGVGLGELIESLDLISDPDPTTQQAGGTAPAESGFYSQTHNQFYGFQLGLDGHIFTSERARLDGALTAGIFHNEIEVAAQALNVDQTWKPDETAFIGTFNLTLVLPADPVNFRIGYQGAYLSGMALSATQSRERRIVSGGGADVTDDVFYHGLLFGIEYLR